MKIIIPFLILSCMLSAFHAASQEVGFYFMDNVYQSNYLNPAKRNKARVHVSFLSPNVHLGHNLPTLKNLSYSESNPKVNANTGISKLKANSLFLTDNTIDAFSLGFQFNKLQVGVAMRLHADMYVHFPKELAKMAFEGNAQYIGKEVDVALNANMTMYRELSFQGSYQVNDKLSIGTRMKILNGLANFSTANSRLSIYTNPEYYQIRATSDYTINSAGEMLDFSLNTNANSQEFELELKSNLNVGDIFSSSNTGFAIDFGAYYQVSPKLKLGLSVLNLGGIGWKENIKNYKSQGTFNFDGIAVNDLFLGGDSLDFKGVVDTMTQVIGFTPSNETYSTSLAPKFYLSASYNVTNSLEVGALFYGRAFKSHFVSSIGLSVQKRFGRILSLGAVYSIQNNQYDNLGFNLGLTLGPIQLYAATDNVFTAFKYNNAHLISMRFGLNVAIEQREKDELSNLD